MKKQFLDEQQILLDSFKLGVQIFKSGFRPSFIVGLWRGGSSIGIYVQECLQTLGVKSNHIAVRTSYQGQPKYQQMLDAPKKHIRVHGTDYLQENLGTDDRLLMVDDVFSSGLNLQAVIDDLQKDLRENMPREIKIATLYRRPAMQKTQFSPDYCLHETQNWLVFPYELQGLSKAEMNAHKPYLAKIIDA